MLPLWARGSPMELNQQGGSVGSKRTGQVPNMASHNTQKSQQPEQRPTKRAEPDQHMIDLIKTDDPSWVCVSPLLLIWHTAKACWELQAVREVTGVHHEIRITLLPPDKCTPPLKGGGISTPTKDHLMGIWIPVIVNGIQWCHHRPHRCHLLIGDREERELMIQRWIGRSFFLN